MLRKTALLLVLALTTGSARLLVCDWACAESMPESHDVACHDTPDVDGETIAGSAHGCAVDADSPAIAVTKTIVTSSVVVHPLMSAGIFTIAAPSQALVCHFPPGAPPAPHPHPVSVLRI